jgi:hypothetical protein
MKLKEYIKWWFCKPIDPLAYRLGYIDKRIDSVLWRLKMIEAFIKGDEEAISYFRNPPKG